MAKTPVDELKAKRIPFLEKREENRALGKKKMSKKIENDCNSGLRKLNIAIKNGGEIADPEADKAAADKAAADKAAADKAAAEKALK